jgi:hypothetical protein
VRSTLCKELVQSPQLLANGGVELGSAGVPAVNHEQLQRETLEVC